MGEVAILDFLFAEFAVGVLIQKFENGRELLTLLLGDQLRANKGQSSSLHRGVSVEVDQVVKCVFSLVLVDDLVLSLLLDPFVLNGLFSGGAFGSVISQQFGDKVLGASSNLFPSRSVEVKLTLLDGFHDLGIRGAVERRNTRKHNISDHTKRPNITFLTVLLVENLGRDIVGGSNHFFENLTGLVGLRCSKIDDLALVEVLVSLKQDIFWL